jgi:hypothetical protein
MPIPEIRWPKVPKQALIDALRNSSLGTANMSQQDKGDLVAVARAGLHSTRGAQLLAHLDTEITHRKGAAHLALVYPKGKPAQ